MNLQTWLAFFAASWAISLSPGSGAVLSMTHGLAYGVRQASATIAGLQLGVAVIFLIAGMGVGALLLTSATAFMVMKVAGALYLFWLGWRQWRAPVGSPTSASSGSHQLPDRTPYAATSLARAQPLHLPSVRKRVLIGFMTNVTNPKGIVFMVAVLPQFIDPSRALWSQLLLLLCTLIVVDLIVMHGYAFLASRAQRWLATARAQRVQNRIFGSVLMCMGGSLLLVKRGAA